MSDPSRVRVTGPLEPFASGFAAELSRQGFTPSSAGLQMGLLAHVSRWLAAAAVLSTETVGRFCEARRASGYTSHVTAKALGPLLGYLRGLGVVPPASAPTRQGPVEELLWRYRRYLEGERGLVAAVARGYVDKVRPFLEGLVGPEGLELWRLDAAGVVAFVVAECPRQSRSSAKLTVTALRSLLGFLLSRASLSARSPGRCRRSPDGGWQRCPNGLRAGRCRRCWPRVTAPALTVAAIWRS